MVSYFYVDISYIYVFIDCLNSDDCGNCGVQTILEFTSFRGYVPGRDYIIGVKGFSSSFGVYTVDINCNIPPTMSPTRLGFTETKFVQILGLSQGPASTSVCFGIGSCVDPTITVEYLPIDYDSSNEYIYVCYIQYI